MDIEPLSLQLIERYLDARDLRFYRGRDGNDILVLFGTQNGSLQVNLRCGGKRGDVMVISVSPAANYPAGERAHLLEVVNEWNRDTHWPKAFVRETSQPDRIGVAGEYSVVLPKGVHYDGLAEILECTLACAGDLFDAVNAAISLPSTQTLEQWLDRTV